MFRIRIIPALMMLAMMMMAMKIVDIMRSTEALAQQEAPPAEKKEIPAAAAQPAEPAAATAQPPAGEKPAEGAAPAEAGGEKPAEATGEKPAEGAAPAGEKASETTKGGEHTKGNTKVSHSEGGEKKTEKNPSISEVAGDIVEHRYTPVEVELLQNLVKRRQELDRWEKNIEIKEAALDATEKRLDDKIGQIDAMKKEVASLLAQYNEKEEGKISSLVKIYENMKPKDAARIFDEVEMPILLLVIDKMSEKKIAPILAVMDPKKAKQITVQLAEQRRVNVSKINPAAAAK